MRALGVDPSSYAIGYAVADEGGDLVMTMQHLTGLHGTSDPGALATAMKSALDQTRYLIMAYKPDKVVIEQLASAQNLKTVRAIMYFEAVCHLAASYYGVEILKPHVGEMRREVFGKGNIPKEDAARVVRRLLGREEMHLPTPRSRKEVPVMTDDETDAYGYACFGVGHRLT